MDTNVLTAAFREATADVEPRAEFAAAVLRGGRRRRTRNRLAVGAAVVVAAVAAVTVLPHESATPRPADPPGTEAKMGHPLMDASGDLIDDAGFVQRAVTAWEEGLPHTPANANGVLAAPLTEPNVAWAGSTPEGPAAMVAQQFTMPKTASVEASYRGHPAIAVGLVAEGPDQQLTLIGVQIEGHWSQPGSFVFPDDRTVIAYSYASPPDSRALNISLGIKVGEDGVSRREWTKPLRFVNGVWIGQLPSTVDKRDVRMIDSKVGLDPNESEVRPMGLHHPLLFVSEYLAGVRTGVPDRGLPWAPAGYQVGQERQVPGEARESFTTALRDSGLLEPTSYTVDRARWTVAAGLADGRTAIVSEWQELDEPAYVFGVLLRDDGSAERVWRAGVTDRNSVLPVAVRLPDGDGWVVAAQGRQVSCRVGEDWSVPTADVALLSDDAVQVKVDDEVVDLPR